MRLPPDSAISCTRLASCSTARASSAFCCTEPLRSCTLAEVCCRLAAWRSVRCASSPVPAASDSLACDTKVASLRMSATSADRLAFMSSSDAAMAPNSSRPSRSMRRDRSPSFIACTPACSGCSERARVRCSDALSADRAGPSAMQTIADDRQALELHQAHAGAQRQRDAGDAQQGDATAHGGALGAMSRSIPEILVRPLHGSARILASLRDGGQASNNGGNAPHFPARGAGGVRAAAGKAPDSPALIERSKVTPES